MSESMTEESNSWDDNDWTNLVTPRFGQWPPGAEEGAAQMDSDIHADDEVTP